MDDGTPHKKCRYIALYVPLAIILFLLVLFLVLAVLYLTGSWRPAFMKNMFPANESLKIPIHPRFEGTGQIDMGSAFGQRIFEICRQNNVKNILEVGSWNGEGTTICVMNAIIDRKGCKLYSVEADGNMFKKATDFWATKNVGKKLKLMNGTLHRDMPEFNNDDALFVWEWYSGEKDVIEKAPLLNIDNVPNLDFIILDGGEYTTRGDFEALISKNTPKYIALDDTRVFKCRDIRKELLEDKKWEMIDDDQEDRHGYSIFKLK